MAYKSFREQAQHYFSRTQTEIPTSVVTGEDAWMRRDLEKRDDWKFTFNTHQIDEITEAIKISVTTNKPLLALTVNDFPLPSIAPLIKQWRLQLSCGLGVQLLSGLPVEQWTRHQAEIFFWCLGLHLGMPGAQNPEGHLLGYVTDTGRVKRDSLVRLYATNADIQYHCDAADVVGLLCLQPAKKGGKSRIVSSVAVFNEVMRQNPILAERLFEPFYLDSRNEIGKDGRQWSQLPACCFDGHRLKTFYHSDYFHSVVRHEDVPPFTDIDKELMDLYEQIANSNDFYVDMDLHKGDIQLISNHSILHARTQYQDYEEECKKRMLLRLWLSL